MKNTLKIVSLAIAVTATLSGTAALAANEPVKPVVMNKQACDAFATYYSVVSAGAKLTNGTVLYAATSLVDQLHLLESHQLITLKDGDVGTLDGFIGLHLPKDGWQYIYNCTSQGKLANITFTVTNPAYQGSRHSQPVIFDVKPQPVV